MSGHIKEELREKVWKPEGLEECSGTRGNQWSTKCNWISVTAGPHKVCSALLRLGGTGVVGTAQLQPCLLALMLVWINQG